MTIITSLAVIYRLAITLLTTTNLRIIHTVSCQFWYRINKPDAFPDGRIPENMCATHEIDQYYTAMVSVFTIVDGLGGDYIFDVGLLFLIYSHTLWSLGIFGVGTSSFLTSRFGRKPVLIGLLVCTMIDQMSLLAFQSVMGRGQFAVFALIMFTETVGNENTTIFFVNMYIVDITNPEERYIPR